jgi:uncharacterized protein YqeY
MEKYKMDKYTVIRLATEEAMKDHNHKKRDALRSVINRIKNAQIDLRCEITNELVDEMLLKEVKTIKEQIDTCPSSRKDLLDTYTYALEVVSEYAPKLMTDSIEIEDYIEYIIENYDVDISNQGTAMKTIMPHLKGMCDMKVASSVIKGMCF